MNDCNDDNLVRLVPSGGATRKEQNETGEGPRVLFNEGLSRPNYDWFDGFEKPLGELGRVEVG